MKIVPNKIDGVYEIFYNVHSDCRGGFVKTYHKELFSELGLREDWVEDYYSTSKKNVIRGMHFQIPPCEHTKLVYCLSGEAFDVLVDLRVGSSSFGECSTFILSPQKANSLYIPDGVAHGFLSLSDNTTLSYKVTSIHSANHDQGVLWNSLDVDWPVDKPIVSARDQSHPSIKIFDSPFIYRKI